MFKLVGTNLGNGLTTAAQVLVTLTQVNLGNGVFVSQLPVTSHDPLGTWVIVTTVSGEGAGLPFTLTMFGSNGDKSSAYVVAFAPFAYSPPVIYSYKPSTGVSTIGGSVLQIQGNNFGVNSPTVLFSGKDADGHAIASQCVVTDVTHPLAVLSPQVISCTVPEGQGN